MKLKYTPYEKYNETTQGRETEHQKVPTKETGNTQLRAVLIGEFFSRFSRFVILFQDTETFCHNLLFLTAPQQSRIVSINMFGKKEGKSGRKQTCANPTPIRKF